MGFTKLDLFSAQLCNVCLLYFFRCFSLAGIHLVGVSEVLQVQVQFLYYFVPVQKCLVSYIKVLVKIKTYHNFCKFTSVNFLLNLSTGVEEDECSLETRAGKDEREEQMHQHKQQVQPGSNVIKLFSSVIYKFL